MAEGEEGGTSWPRKVGSIVPDVWAYPDRRGWHYAWSPQAQGRVWCGENVVAGLVEAIDAHVAETWRSRQSPLLIGCCPWLTDPAVGRALASLRSCLVIGKPERSHPTVVRRLMRDGRPVHKGELDGLNGVALPSPDGVTPAAIIGDGDHLSADDWALHDVELGPIRVAGWQDTKTNPMLHAKVVVMAYSGEFPDAGPMDEDWAGVVPTSVWWGSANLTYSSRRHIEFATWSNDPMLVFAAWRFVCDVIAVSEPYTEVASPQPTPQFVDAVDKLPDPDWRDIEEYLAHLAEREAEGLDD